MFLDQTALIFMIQTTDGWTLTVPMLATDATRGTSWTVASGDTATTENGKDIPLNASQVMTELCIPVTTFVCDVLRF